MTLSTCKKPETRYPDGDQFAADLRDMMADLSSLKKTAVVAPLPNIQNGMSVTAINHDTTAVQSPLVYEAIHKTQREVFVFDKTTVTDFRGDKSKI